QVLPKHSAINVRTHALPKQAVLGVHTVFHRLQHDLQEHALDLRRDVLRIRFRRVVREVREFWNHMISSSAWSAPAVFSASRIAIVSRGVTPKEFSARIRSSTVAPRPSVTKLLFCSCAVSF